MKKTLLTGALLISTSMAFSQSYYAGINVGYGFSGPSEAIGTIETINSSFESTETNIYGTYGSGLNLGLNLGYMVSDHIGFDLGLNYLMGPDVKTMDVTVAGSSGSAVVTSKSTQYRAQPSIILSTGGDKVSVYTRSGLVIPLGGTTITQYRDDIDPSDKIEADYESGGTFSLGFQGALGASISLGEKLSFFGEFTVINLRIKSESLTMTRYTVNGNDELGNQPTYGKETIYLDELTPSSNNFDYNSGASLDKAKESLANTSNYNSMFINIGIKYSF